MTRLGKYEGYLVAFAAGQVHDVKPMLSYVRTKVLEKRRAAALSKLTEYPGSREWPDFGDLLRYELEARRMLLTQQAIKYWGVLCICYKPVDRSYSNRKSDPNERVIGESLKRYIIRGLCSDLRHLGALEYYLLGQSYFGYDPSHHD